MGDLLIVGVQPSNAVNIQTICYCFHPGNSGAHKWFTCHRCPYLNLSEISLSPSKSKSTHTVLGFCCNIPTWTTVHPYTLTYVKTCLSPWVAQCILQGWTEMILHLCTPLVLIGIIGRISMLHRNKTNTTVLERHRMRKRDLNKKHLCYIHYQQLSQNTS